MKKHLDKIVILILSLLGIVLVLYATAPYGTGISGDSVAYLSGAENILAGNGYSNYYGNLITLYPPFLSYFMALLMSLFKISASSAGNIINALSFGGTVFISGLILKKVFVGKPWIYFVGTVLILFSRPLFVITTTIAADTLFNVFVLSFFYFFCLFSKSKEIKYLIIIAIISSFSVLIRYLGVIYIFSGVVMAFITAYPNWKKGIRNSLLYGIISSIGTLYFVIYRNYFGFGTFTGNWGGEKDFFGNLVFSINRISNWFIPHSLSKLIPLNFIIFIALMALGFFLYKKGLKNIINQGNDPFLIFILLTSAIYYSVVIFATFSNDHIHYADDRYYLPLYFPLLLSGIVIFDRILFKHLKNIEKLIFLVIVVFFFVYHVEGIRSQISKTRGEGGEVYNMYNTSKIRDMTIFDFVDNQFTEDYKIVSNISDIVYLYTTKTSSQSYHGGQHPTMDNLKTAYPEFQQVEPYYLIWFNDLGIDWSYYTPEQLSHFYEMQLIFETTYEDGFYMDDNWITETIIESQVFIIYP